MIVDRCAYSHFSYPDEEILGFARRHQKPVFIAEASPVLTNGDAFSNTDLSNPKIAEKAWDEWFVPFFETILYRAEVSTKILNPFYSF